MVGQRPQALYARFRLQGRDSYGLVDGDRVTPIEGDLFGAGVPVGAAMPLSEVHLLPPVHPGKILAAAVNYPSHVPSARTVLKQGEAPANPQFFLKPSSSIIGPDETIVLPEEARRVDAEGELVAIIGRSCRSVSVGEALAFVFGYTCGNDVSARHWQRDDLQWWRAKGSDSFTPIGPFIAAGLDPASLHLRTLLNGQEAQAASTSTLIHSLAALISFASQTMTLEPGDLIFTGTPGETPTLNDGDMVEVEIEGIGTLRNYVRKFAN